jgi:hypothetical protein
MQQSIVKFYYFVVQILLNMFRALLCPSSGDRQTAVTASGFRMDVEVDVFSAVVEMLVGFFFIVSVFLVQRECNHSIDVVPVCCQFMFYRVV